MALSLVKIHSFVAVAEAGQFRKAAEKIGVSQAALSTNVRDLERHLGVALFSRTTRSVRLTVEGERFLRNVRLVVDDLAAAVADVRDQAELKRGRLIVAATPSVASNILPGAISAFKERFPGVQVQVAEDSSSGVEQRVETGAADFGVGPMPARRADLAFNFLCRDRFVGVVASSNPLARRKMARLSQLLAYPVLTTGPDSSIYNSLRTVLDQRGMEFRTDHLLSQHQTIVAMVAAGLGVAILPMLALGNLDLRNIATLDILDVEIGRDIGVLQHKGGSVSSAAQEFLRYLRAPTSSLNPDEAL
jgi:LysR family carnitine catabolism transcriptional activator